MIAETTPTNLTDIPDVDNDFSADSGSGMNCTVCGKDIGYLYSGRGRKPTKCEDHKKNSSASNLTGSRGSSDIKQALATLDFAYSALGMILTMVGATEAAGTLSMSIAGLQEKNASFLAQDKEMVKRINSLGKTGGRYGFFAANAMTLVPVGAIAAQEIKARFGKANDDV